MDRQWTRQEEVGSRGNVDVKTVESQLDRNEKW